MPSDDAQRVRPDRDRPEVPDAAGLGAGRWRRGSRVHTLPPDGAPAAPGGVPCCRWHPTAADAVRAVVGCFDYELAHLRGRRRRHRRRRPRAALPAEPGTPRCGACPAGRSATPRARCTRRSATSSRRPAWRPRSSTSSASTSSPATAAADLPDALVHVFRGRIAAASRCQRARPHLPALLARRRRPAAADDRRPPASRSPTRWPAASGVLRGVQRDAEPEIPDVDGDDPATAPGPVAALAS